MDTGEKTRKGTSLPDISTHRMRHESCHSKSTTVSRRKGGDVAMSTGNEERMTKLLNYPFGSYLMLRLEYVLLTEGDELEAKIMRLIEKRMDDHRKQLYQNVVNAASAGS